jgi:hypothetical protein
MTRTDPDLPADVRDGIEAHLQRVDLRLRLNGVPGDERQETLALLRTQVTEMVIGRTAGTPTPADLTAVLRAVDPPEAYADDAVSVGRAMRVLWERAKVGYILRVAENDGGVRRVYWGRLAGLGAAITGVSFVGGAVVGWAFIGGDQAWWSYGLGCGYPAGLMWVWVTARLLLMPVTSLPPRR